MRKQIITIVLFIGILLFAVAAFAILFPDAVGQVPLGLLILLATFAVALSPILTALKNLRDFVFPSTDEAGTVKIGETKFQPVYRKTQSWRAKLRAVLFYATTSYLRYFEKRPNRLRLVLTAYVFFVIGLFAILNNQGNRWALVLLIVGFILSPAFNDLQLRRSIYLKRELHGSNQVVRVLKKLVNIKPFPMKILRYTEAYDIKENGDAKYTRTILAEKDKEDVPWYRMFLRRANKETFEFSRDTLNLEAKLLPSKNPLAKVITHDDIEGMEMVVVFDPPIGSRFRSTEFEVKLDWPGLFVPLFDDEKFEDQGSITFLHETAEVYLEFYAPKDFQFTDFIIRPDFGEHVVVDLPALDNRSALIFYGKKPEKTKYSYTLEVTKRPPN